MLNGLQMAPRPPQLMLIPGGELGCVYLLSTIPTLRAKRSPLRCVKWYVLYSYTAFFLHTLNCLARFPEFFLHHEGFNWQRATSRTPSTYLTEQYHSTPEAQSDEPYNHPEDIEHFAHHKPIEREEARRETKYQDITAKEALF